MSIKDKVSGGWHSLCKKYQRSAFGTLEKRSVYQWFLHNIIFGSAGIWVPLLALALFASFDVNECLLAGGMPMFAVTLSAVSLGFFVKETQINLRRRAVITYAALMLTMVVSVVTCAALALAPKVPTLPIKMEIVFPVTIIVVVTAIFSNFRLFTLQLASSDQGAIERELNKPVEAMGSQAKGSNHVDNIRL